MEKEYWIKTMRHDGWPQWDGVIGENALKKKMANLRKEGYTPKIDHKMTTITHKVIEPK